MPYKDVWQQQVLCPAAPDPRVTGQKDEHTGRAGGRVRSGGRGAGWAADSATFEMIAFSSVPCNA